MQHRHTIRSDQHRPRHSHHFQQSPHKFHALIYYLLLFFSAGLFINDGGATVSNGGLEVTMDGATVADGGMVIQNSGTAKAALEVNFLMRSRGLSAAFWSFLI